MTDYFALLQQPRQPWLDLDQLEKKYRMLARSTHPDESPPREAAAFAEVNKAYQTLRHPRSRLQHLLMLEGEPPARHASDVPPDLVELFMQIAPAIKRGEQEKIATLITRLEESWSEALHELRVLSDRWSGSSSLLAEARTLHHRFSFLTRWRDVLEERRFNLSAPR